MPAAQDGPQRSDMTGIRFLAPQLGLETVIDLAGVVEANEEAEAGDIDVRQWALSQRAEPRPNRRQVQ